MVLDIANRSHTNSKKKNSRKPFKWILIDSALIGLISCLATLPETFPTLQHCWTAVKAFLGGFILQMIVERGIKKK